MGRRDASLTCVNGHFYTEKNTVWGKGTSGKPQKSCRICKANRDYHSYHTNPEVRARKKLWHQRRKATLVSEAKPERIEEETKIATLKASIVVDPETEKCP